MTADDIIRIMEKAKEIGIRAVDVKLPNEGNLKFSFVADKADIEEQIKSSVPELKAEDIVKPLSVLDEMSPEEILYYAVPHYDEIQAEKEAHKKKLEEEKV